MIRLIAITIALAAVACEQQPCDCTYAEGEAFQKAIGAWQSRDDAYRAEWDLDRDGMVGSNDFVVWVNRCKAR